MQYADSIDEFFTDFFLAAAAWPDKENFTWVIYLVNRGTNLYEYQLTVKMTAYAEGIAIAY